MNGINQDAMRHGKRTQRSVKEDVPFLSFDITPGFSHGSIVNSLCASWIRQNNYLILQNNIRIFK